MDLLKALELHELNKILDDYQKLGACSDTRAIKAISLVWDDFAQENKAAIYGSATYNVPKTNLGCASCVKDMFQLVINWRRILGERKQTVPFKGVPQKKANVEEVRVISKPQAVKTVASVVEPKTKVVITETDIKKSAEDIKKVKAISYTGMKMGELRTEAKKRGLKFTNSVRKEELIEMLSK